MYRFNRKHILVLAFSSGVSLLCAATAPIGVATSTGKITIDFLQTAGNATIFDGSTLQTEQVTSHVRLKGGAQAWLGTESRGKVFSDHLDLQQGSARVSGYSANASGLSVRTDGPGSANVVLRGKTVEVAALVGNVHVFNAAGINVANLLPGHALNLVPADAGASAVSSLSGCVRSGSQKNLVLTDETSNVTVQLRGGKDIKAGRLVKVSGDMVRNAVPGTGANPILNVSEVADQGACPAPAARNAGTAAAAAAGTAAAGTAGAAAGTTAGAAGASTAAGAAGAAAGTAGAATAGAVVAGISAAVTLATTLPAVNGSGGFGQSGGKAVCTSPCTF